MFLGEALAMGVIGSCVGIAAGYYLAIGRKPRDGLGGGPGVRNCFDCGAAAAAC